MISKYLEEVPNYFISMRVCQTHRLLVHSLKSEGAILQLQFSAHHTLKTCISQVVFLQPPSQDFSQLSLDLVILPLAPCTEQATFS